MSDDEEIRALREWTGTTDQELAIPELARTILEEGQHRACIVRETEDGYVLVDGTFSYLKRQFF